MGTSAETEVAQELIIPDQLDESIRQALGRIATPTEIKRGAFYDRFNQSELVRDLARSSREGKIYRIAFRNLETVGVTVNPLKTPVTTPDTAVMARAAFSELSIEASDDAFVKRYEQFQAATQGKPPETDLNSVGSKIPPGSQLDIVFSDMGDAIRDFHGERFDGVLDYARLFGYYLVERVMMKLGT